MKVDAVFREFIEKEVLPAVGIHNTSFWSFLQSFIKEFTPRNLELLETRKALQQKIDQWHKSNKYSPQHYKQFLESIGYLLPQLDAIAPIQTTNVDDEIAKIPGPQLVVPIDNARYALNAANARWGSLYDALYGTDAMGDHEGRTEGGKYNPVRGQRVINFGRKFLDSHLPLASGSHSDALRYYVAEKKLMVSLKDSITTLKHPLQFIGFSGEDENDRELLLRHNDLHVIIQIKKKHPIGKDDKAGIADIVLEAAITAIADMEDSVSCVDGVDKIGVYRNWLGLMSGTLSATFPKGKETVKRTLNADKLFIRPDGRTTVTLPGRSLLLVRNVGIHMKTPAVHDENGNEAFEGLIDSVVSVLISLIDLRKPTSSRKNSRTGSIYVVKPKMHGPEEVSFVCDTFARIEEYLKLPQWTIKIGIMDEERRTSVNLARCIEVAKHRVVFINTGFLDRTGDEIRTCLEAGPVVRKTDMKKQPWIQTYENNNVVIGLLAGFSGKAQIGKGMWAAPDNMKDMIAQKIAHPNSGANTAWVPSPTAATLHAIHYHEIFVFNRQKELLEKAKKNIREAVDIDHLIVLPILTNTLTKQEIKEELENNVQGILGYVVRWIQQGIGCSKVPDVHDVGLMEDRATLRISSQHIANWLYHRIITKEEVLDSLKRIAILVDRQNQSDAKYRPMAKTYSDTAFHCAQDLIFEGLSQPNGYTEFLLHKWRRTEKQSGPAHSKL